MDAKHSNKLVVKLLETLENAKIKVPRFAKETGIPKDRIYKWFQEGTNPKAEDATIIEKWINGYSKMENGGVENRILTNSHERTTLPSERPHSATEAYMKLLEDNDRFFKTQYHNLLLSLNKLMEIGLRSEELIKLNLEHIGNVEALQKGLKPEDVHEQINNQIAGIEEGE